MINLNLDENINQKKEKIELEEKPEMVPIHWLDTKEASTLGYERRVNFKRAMIRIEKN